MKKNKTIRGLTIDRPPRLGAPPQPSLGGHKDTDGAGRDAPSSPLQLKRVSAEIAPSPERLGVLPPSTSEIVPYRAPSEAPVSAVGGSSSASVDNDRPNFDTGRDLKPRKVKVRMGPGHPDFHSSIASVVKNLPCFSSYLSASKKVYRRVQEHDSGIQMTDLSGGSCGDRAVRQAAVPVSSGTLLKNRRESAQSGSRSFNSTIISKCSSSAAVQLH